jgi:hypothetical protein
MRKSVLAVMLILAGLFTMSCSDNRSAKQFGGKMTITLPENRKLVNVTYKQDNIWILSRPMKAEEQPETYKFFEKSSLGIFEGEITFVEVKK